jgi:NAD(P)-dependent dehydrogenase (short-subunit alcohol dehydrogenase family)
MDLHLNDKTALVTGSTAGIGLEIARKLAVEGAKVIITGRNKGKLDQAVDSIRASGGAPKLENWARQHRSDIAF